MPTKVMLTPNLADPDLVARSIEGDRAAFRQIVERYQTLIASIAYSAIGNLSRSEDVAQETFITAWAQLRSLREPAKLRGWLCGIVRHQVRRDWRVGQREPLRDALPVEHAHALPARDATPAEHAVMRDDESLLWRSLGKIPPLYREPMILFYREHRSIERVAVALNLSEDAVKQRLSRGRKLLEEHVRTFVEETLQRSGPGHTFSGVVVSALPMAGAPAVSTVAAGWGANGTAAAKSGIFTNLIVPLAPFLGIAAGLGAHCLLVSDGSSDERRRSRKLAPVIAGWILYLGLAVGGEAGVHGLARKFGWSVPAHFIAVATFWWLFVAATITFQALLARAQAFKRASELAAGGLSKPMKQPRAIAVVVGAHLALFSWLIALAWRYHDETGVVMIVVPMLLLPVWAVFRLRTLDANGLRRRLGAHLTLAAAFILLIVNLRAAVWVSTAYGVDVARVHAVVPTWIIPMFTIALVGWIAFVFALMKRAARETHRPVQPHGRRNGRTMLHS